MDSFSSSYYFYFSPCSPFSLLFLISVLFFSTLFVGHFLFPKPLAMQATLFIHNWIPIFHSQTLIDPSLKKGSLVHEAPIIVGSREGQMYAVLSVRVEKLFLCFEPVTSRLQWSSLIIAPWLILLMNASFKWTIISLMILAPAT